MGGSRQLFVSAVVALSLLASPTAAAASATAPQAPPSPWLTLSMLNRSGAAVLGGAPAATLCGAAGAAAAQAPGGCVLPQVGTVPVAQPSAPPQPGPPPAFVGSSTPPLPVILVWLAVIGLDIYLLLKDHDDNRGNSPT